MNKPTGGQAFPGATSEPPVGRPFRYEELPLERGMTLRDYFATKALAALIPQLAFPTEEVESVLKKAGIDPATETEAFAAMTAYDFADAMIKVRSE